jgi:hypothetical protein
LLFCGLEGDDVGDAAPAASSGSRIDFDGDTAAELDKGDLTGDEDEAAAPANML